MSDPLADIRIELIKLREARGLSQAAVANRLRVTQAAMSMYESGRRTPNARRFADWAKVVGAQLLIGVPRA